MRSFKGYVKCLVAGLAMSGVMAPVAMAQKTVRIAYVTTESSPQHNQSKRFAEMIEERLPGHFNFRLYPNGQLGSEKTSLEQLQLGELEMANIVTPIMEADRSLEIFDLPFLFKDRDHARRALNAELRGKMVQAIEKKTDVEVLGIYENGFRHTMSRREIVVPSDMKGMKIRIAGGKLRQDVFRAMGANPTPIDWTEVFTALQTGVVDGAEAAIYGLYEAKLYQITPHLSLTSHAYAPSFLVVSRDFWSKLSAEEQKVFHEVGEELVSWAFDFSERTENEQLEEMSKYAKINKIDFEKFQEVTAPTYETYAKQYGSEWLDVIRGAAQ
jgi:tripartite ATP-independent transporter DctP family solute receptor